MTAPVVPTPKRNRVGIAALVIALIVLVLPVLVFIVTTVVAAIEQSGGAADPDQTGWNILGGFVFAAITVPILSPLAILALVLGIVAVARTGYRKVQGIIAIVLSIAPALAVFAIPAAFDTLF